MSSRGGRGNYRRGRGRGGANRRRGGNNSSGSSSQSNSRSQNPQRPRQVQQPLIPCPYRKWEWYFPGEDYTPGNPLLSKIEAFKNYFEQHSSQYSKDNIERIGSVTLDYEEIINDNGLNDSFPTFATELKGNPEKSLQCIGLAIYQVLTGIETEPPTPVLDFPYIQARVINYDCITPLKNLKSNYFGKFVAIRGTVVRVSNVKPLVIKMAFSCNACEHLQSITLPDGKYQLPTKCPSSECQGRSFTPERSSSLTTTTDWQTIRIQEIMDDKVREAGRIPRTVECELTADLVDSCVPGDVVTVTGIVKVTNSEEYRNKYNKDKCMFLLYVHANAVNNNKGSCNNAETDPDNAVSMEFTLKELYAIQEIQSEKNLFKLIVGSLCPSIYGHECVKAGLILGLIGGTQRYVNDKNRIPVRGNPHVLVVGDPGLGKSQMLQAVSNVAPRGVYVCGNTTSTTGLTVTLSKDGSSGDYALEAGALVLGDQGCCCIDEFDKMGNQHQALLEAMEQQSISIAKAGIVCSLPARTSIIAAANPVGGHYNKAKTVSENLKMGSALLSRFDLVFILLDKPDEEMDCMLTEHVMALHAGKSAFGTATARRPAEGSSDDDDEARQQWEADKPLSERLKISASEPFDPIPAPLLRKYIGYARKYVHPKLTQSAAKVIQDFYLSLRRQYQAGDSTPITTRQLESLIRLTEGRARLELREKATHQDAEEVVEIMKHSLVDTYSDDFGVLDFQRSQHGSGMSSKAMGKRFVAELGKIADREYNSLFTIDQMRRVAMDLGLKIRSFEDFIYSLNNQGFLLKKGARVYQLQIASCL